MLSTKAGRSAECVRMRAGGQGAKRSGTRCEKAGVSAVSARTQAGGWAAQLSGARAAKKAGGSAECLRV